MSSQLVSDQQLIKEYLNGNQNSFEILVKRHKDRVYTYILMIVKNKHLAEDIFQDTFIKVIKTMKRGKYREEGKFLPWVMRIAHNLTIDHFRKAKKMRKVDSKNEDFDIFDIISSNDENVEQSMVKRQIHRDLRKLIENLPQEQKEVLIMRHFAQMSFKEIAEITDVSINTALGRMRYALINMRKMIDENNMSMEAA